MKKISLLVSALFLIVLASCTNETPKENSVVEKNKEAFRKVYNAFETGNTEGIENYVAENHIEHTPDPNIKSTGIQAIKDAIVMFHTAFPDMKTEIISMTGEGDKVTTQFRMKGTNSGPMGAMPATNKSIDITGVDIVRFENGKGVEHWGYMEEQKMMTQLGLMPQQNNMAEGNMPETQEKK